jgi:hypothetical protein
VSAASGPDKDVSNDLSDRIRLTTGAEQQVAIGRLIDHAEATNDRDVWNLAAMGLSQGQRFDEALDILTQLVDKFRRRIPTGLI